MTVNIEAHATLVYTATRALDGLIMDTQHILCTLKYDIERLHQSAFYSLNLYTNPTPAFTHMHPVIHSPVRRDVALHPGVSLEGKTVVPLSL